ncbi:MAG: class II aldolase/adducin family protein [Candidatus Cloacimonetes bacterium]|nr:class II aldolase/adducin family protein [Candidatus Cloacimonadota bacterium]
MPDYFQDFIDISHFAGERFDLVQAGGGNAAVKIADDEMLIKASGYTLSEVSKNNAYSKVKTSKVKNLINHPKLLSETDKVKRGKICTQLLQEATIHNAKPSIETLLHSLLLRYSLHTHPLALNIILVMPNWQSILQDLFQEIDIALVNYHTPGIELAMALSRRLNSNKKNPKVIFLQNHGLIIHSDSKKDINDLTQLICLRLEKYLGLDLSHYRLCNKISSLLKSIQSNTNITYLSDDHILNTHLSQDPDLFSKGPFCPDSLVYCGEKVLHLSSLDNSFEVGQFLKDYKQLPKVIIINQRIYFVAQNIHKAKQIEEVFKFHISVLSQCKNQVNYLDSEEICYLNNWDAEKFRQNLLK